MEEGRAVRLFSGVLYVARVVGVTVIIRHGLTGQSTMADRSGTICTTGP